MANQSRVKKNTYYKINGTPVSKNDSDDETVVFLENHFRKHNYRLNELLNQNGYRNFPLWLKPVKEIA